VNHLDLERLGGALGRQWRFVGALALLAGAASFVVADQQTRVYTATATVLFEGPQQNVQIAQLAHAPSPADPQAAATSLQLLEQLPGLPEATALAVGHGLTGRQVSEEIVIAKRSVASTATVAATDRRPQIAAAVANAYVQQFIVRQRTRQLHSIDAALIFVERQLGSLSRRQLAGPVGQGLRYRRESLQIYRQLQDGGTRLLRAAATPRTPSSPRLARDTAAALLLGLMIGAAVAYCVDRNEDRVGGG
jgi:uncharacterized protein involved in exopolysaccharide biosynthesis